jgi:single-stranded DNA-specific DHH superfamily exonuclease
MVGLITPKTMNNISEKIELLQEQINNIEKSGFFTETDMDRLTRPLQIELEILTGMRLNPVFNVDYIIIVPNRNVLTSKG